MPAKLHDVVLIHGTKSPFDGKHAEVIKTLKGGARVKGADIDIATGQTVVFTLDLEEKCYTVDEVLSEKLRHLPAGKKA